MLYEIIADGFGNDRGFNCAEKILYGANEAYGLGLDEDVMKLAGGFGGGLGVESACGALCGGVMVLSRLLIKTTAHQTQNLKRCEEEFLNGYKEEMGSILCEELKFSYRTKENGCQRVIEKAAEYLDQVVSRIKAEGLSE
ncbi:MAG: C-GCAxxG-C-C family protein [Peptococcaceae bacterium]|jgi:C_GCAxxG_C_C family probable redox protein|nr:C-GCAxxG-C-C family protein [Peptococcaceae bacterium]